jgi:hypothetical protein
MKSSKPIISFQEFYYLEEGILDDIKIKKKEILDRWEQIKFLLKEDNYGRPINTKKVRSLKDEIFLLLKRLKDESIESAKEIISKFLEDFINVIKNEKLQTFFRISVWILHLMAVLGIYKLKEISIARRLLDSPTSAEMQEKSPTSEKR